jgi:putative transcriptional regulator
LTKPIDPIKRDWMKVFRKERKIKTREISEHFGISSTHYNDIENGRRNPSIELSLAMAKYFDVPIEQLLLEDRTKFTKGD